MNWLFLIVGSLFIGVSANWFGAHSLDETEFWASAFGITVGIILVHISGMVERDE